MKISDKYQRAVLGIFESFLQISRTSAKFREFIGNFEDFYGVLAVSGMPQELLENSMGRRIQGSFVNFSEGLLFRKMFRKVTTKVSEKFYSEVMRKSGEYLCYIRTNTSDKIFRNVLIRNSGRF